MTWRSLKYLQFSGYISEYMSMTSFYCIFLHKGSLFVIHYLPRGTQNSCEIDIIDSFLFTHLFLPFLRLRITRSINITQSDGTEIWPQYIKNTQYWLNGWWWKFVIFKPIPKINRWIFCEIAVSEKSNGWIKYLYFADSISNIFHLIKRLYFVSSRNALAYKNVTNHNPNLRRT